MELLQQQVTHHRHYTTVVGSTFRSCDRDADNLLSTHELLKCIKRNHTAFHTWLGHRGELAGTLCVDAMVEVADRNSDWLLSLKEFQAFMAHSYHPPNKKCPLEDRYYRDGEEVTIDCSTCVCAGGNWSCVGFSCESKTHKKEKKGGHHHAKKDNTISRHQWERLLQDLNDK